MRQANLTTPLLLRSLRSPLFCLLALLSGLAAPAARAQVAFNGVLATVGTRATNEDNLEAVAVDSGGNVYAIDRSFSFTGNSPFPTTVFTLVKFAVQTDGSYVESTLATPPSGHFLAGVAVDAGGNVYYTDLTSSAIVELTPSGSGYTSSTLSISISQPLYMAVDASGNLYIVANSGAVYEEALSAGTYTQYQVWGGNGAGNDTGVAVDAAGNVYVSEISSQAIEVLTNQGSHTYSATGLPVSGSPYNAFPDGIAVDSAGNLYISDDNNDQLLKFTPSSGSYTESTVLTGLAGPQGLALGTSGTIFIANATDILSFQPQSVNFGTQAVAATSGTSTNTIALPFSISAGQTLGSVSILTTGIAGLDFTDAGSSTCTAQTYSSATSCVVNVNFTPLAPGLRQGAVVIFDGNNVPLVTVPLYGTGSGPLPVFPPAAPSLLSDNIFYSNQLAVDAAGNIYAADSSGVVKIAPGGTTTTVYSGFVTAIAVDGAGNLYVSDFFNYEYVQIVRPNGTQSDFPGVYAGVNNLAVDGAGNLYYAASSQVFKVSPSGLQTLLFTVYPGGFSTGVAVDAAGDVFICDSQNNSVYEVSAQGVTTTLASGLGEFRGIAVDPAGNVYATENDTGNIDEITPAGTVTYLTTSGNRPYGLAIDQSGNIYFSDQFTNSIYKIVRTAPPSLAFASTQQGGESQDSPQNASVQNIGNAALTFSTVTYPADFQQDSPGTSFCNTTTPVASGSSCTFNPDFKPVAAVTYPNSNSLSESVTFTDNYLASPSQSIAVSGTETAPQPTAATPFFSVNGGALNNPQPVTIFDTTPGAVIYYTVNGTTPTTSSPIYSGPISLPYGFTLQAIATASGYSQSSVQSATYTLAAATPTASVASGTYTSAQTVVLSTASTAAIIFYTTNGLPPTTSSAHYTGPITVGASETLKFFAIATGYTASPVVTAQYYISPVPTAPTFSPASGTYNNAQPITLSDNGTGATLYYTLDGSTPTTASTRYTGPIAMQNGQTINAVANVPGYGLSPVGTASYVLAAATPTASVASGTYTSAQTVVLSTASTAAIIFYTTNGLPPTTSSAHYTGPITVGASETLKFFAIATGYTASPVVTAQYYISPVPTAPTFSPAGGTYNNAQPITLSDNGTGATLYYTLDGSTPTTASTRYTGPIAMQNGQTINAIANVPGYGLSPVGTASYVLAAATPTASVASGTYTSAQTVVLSTASTAAIIFYTTNGLPPTTSSAHYTGPITVGASETLKFFAIATGYTASPVVTAQYYISPVPTAPTISPAGGTYNNAQPITLSDNGTGATLYYTLDGSTPTTASTRYTGPIAMQNGQTINAVANVPGYGLSPVGTASYVLAAATPTASVASGTYTSAQTVVLSTASTAAIIFYTTNGLPPTTSSAHYTGPITVGASETLKFFAIATGYTASPVVTAQYTISPSPDATTSSSAGGTDSNAHPTSQYGDSSAGGQPKFPYFPTQP